MVDRAVEDPNSKARVGGAAVPRPGSVFADLMGDRIAPWAVTMPDVIAVVVGFAVAAYVYRETILVVQRDGAAGQVSVGVVAYTWLGTVLAGPLVMGLRRLQRGRRGRLSSGEAIWCVLGLCWMAVVVAHGLVRYDPIGLTNLASRAAALAAGLCPVLTVIVWHLERGRTRPAGPHSWCHHVGICCAAAWPAAWAAATFLLAG